MEVEEEVEEVEVEEVEVEEVEVEEEEEQVQPMQHRVRNHFSPALRQDSKLFWQVIRRRWLVALPPWMNAFATT